MKTKPDGDLYDAFPGPVEWRGQAAYILASDAETFLDHIIHGDARLFGIDGALLTAGATTQPLDAMLDLSGSPRAFDAARQFIRDQRARVTHFSFVVEMNSKMESKQGSAEVSA